MRTVTVWLVLATGVIKLGDVAVSLIVLVAPERRWAKRLVRPGEEAPDWAPVFAFAQRHSRGGGVVIRGATRVLVDVVFRAPVLAILQASALLLCVDPTRLREARTSGCVFGSSVPTTSSLPVVAAAICVVAATSTVIYQLGAAIRAPSDPGRVAGQSVFRATGAADAETSTLASSLVIVSLTAALIVIYASYYFALFAHDPTAFSVTAPSCDLDVTGALYFSTVTAATVGFGDITPVSQAARLGVISQIFVSATLLALVVATFTGKSPGSSTPPEPRDNPQGAEGAI
jgi:hypothetical protein